MDCSPTRSSVHRILHARRLEWMAIPFSRGSSRHRDWTQVSHIAGRFFTIWATREALTTRTWVTNPFGDILLRFFYRKHPLTLLEKAIAPHSSTLAWKIPWTEEPAKLQSMGSHRVRQDWSDLAAAAASLFSRNFEFWNILKSSGYPIFVTLMNELFTSAISSCVLHLRQTCCSFDFCILRLTPNEQPNTFPWGWSLNSEDTICFFVLFFQMNLTSRKNSKPRSITGLLYFAKHLLQEKSLWNLAPFPAALG